MTHYSIKLLALAVICGSSLIAVAINGRDKEPVLSIVMIVAIIWFIFYWIACSLWETKK